MTKLCIFDLDGTVLNTLTTIAYYGNNALSAYGIQPIDEEDYKLLIGKGIVNLIKNMLNFRGCMSEENFDARPCRNAMTDSSISATFAQCRCYDSFSPCRNTAKASTFIPINLQCGRSPTDKYAT